jgi:hypothetical protein
MRPTCLLRETDRGSGSGKNGCHCYRSDTGIGISKETGKMFDRFLGDGPTPETKEEAGSSEHLRGL